MKLYPRLSTRYRCWVDAPPAEVEERLRQSIGHSLRGSVGEGSFKLTRKLPVRTSRALSMLGQLSPAGTGTLVEVRVRIPTFVHVFVLVHSLFFLGLSYFIVMAAFAKELPISTAVLFEAVGAQTDDLDELAALQQVANPEEMGAETRAPWSLEARSSLEGVHFTLRSAANWLDVQQRTPLEADSAALRVAGRTLAWHEVMGVSVAEPREGRAQLVVRSPAADVVVDTGGHALADVQWLAAWLLAHKRRLAATLQEQEQAHDARVALSRARQSAQRTQ